MDSVGSRVESWILCRHFSRFPLPPPRLCTRSEEFGGKGTMTHALLLQRNASQRVELFCKTRPPPRPRAPGSPPAQVFWTPAEGLLAPGKLLGSRGPWLLPPECRSVTCVQVSLEPSPWLCTWCWLPLFASQPINPFEGSAWGFLKLLCSFWKKADRFILFQGAVGKARCEFPCNNSSSPSINLFLLFSIPCIYKEVVH